MPTRTRKPAARKILTFRLIVDEQDSYMHSEKLLYGALKRGNRHVDEICDDWCRTLGVRAGEYTVTLKPVAPATRAKKTAKKARKRAR